MAETGHIYQVKELKPLTKEQFRKALTILTKAFVDDPVFEFIFRDGAELRHFLQVCLEYYLKMGVCFGAFDEKRKLCGLALWNEPGGQLITVPNVIKSNMLGAYLKLLVTIAPDSTYRMLKMSDVTQEHHMKDPHWYLFLLASVQPGAGSALMEYMAAQHGDFPFYLENSKPEKNAHFYHKLGLEDLPTVAWREGIVAPMVRQPNAE